MKGDHVRMKKAVCRVDELPPGTIRAVKLGLVGIAIARTPEGEVHAVRDSCPHRGSPLSLGRLLERIGGRDCNYERVVDDYILRCSCHAYEV